MSKKLIVAMALSLVLVSGSLFSAQADCGLNPCGWRLNLNPCSWRWPSCLSCGARDTDKRDADGAYKFPNNGVYEPSPWPPGQ